MEERLLKLTDVETILSIKKSKLYRMISEGSFPKPVALGPRSVRWRSSDIQNWIERLSEKEVAA